MKSETQALLEKARQSLHAAGNCGEMAFLILLPHAPITLYFIQLKRC